MVNALKTLYYTITAIMIAFCSVLWLLWARRISVSHWGPRRIIPNWNTVECRGTMTVCVSWDATIDTIGQIYYADTNPMSSATQIRYWFRNLASTCHFICHRNQMKRQQQQKFKSKNTNQPTNRMQCRTHLTNQTI